MKDGTSPYSTFNPDPFLAHRKMIDLVGKGKDVLELGCAAGYLSREMKRNDCTIVGVDIDRELLQKARKYLRETICGDLDTIELDFSKESFDVILMGDVLEHLRYPEDMLRRIRPFIKQNGYIVVSVPNVANWEVRKNLLWGRFNYTDKGIMDRNHVRFFTLDTITRILNDAGYKIVHLDVAANITMPILWRFSSERKDRLAKRFKTLFAGQFIIKAERTRQ